MLISDFDFVLRNFQFWAPSCPFLGPKGGQKGAKRGQNESFSNIVVSYIDLDRFLMLISDFDFVLRIFQFWAPSRPFLGPKGGQKGAKRGQNESFSNIVVSDIDLNRFLMLISDFDIVLRNFQFWAPSRTFLGPKGGQKGAKRGQKGPK